MAIFSYSFAVSALLPAALAQTCWLNINCTGPLDTAFPGPWESNIYSPSSRTVSPANILSLDTASVLSAYPGPSTLVSNASALVFDFGIEVGGIVTVDFSTTEGAGALGLAFSEAKNWIGLAR